MKQILFVLLVAVVLSACGAPATTPTSTNTPSPTPAKTPLPTATLTPSPTPIPLGGGGKFIMRIPSHLIPDQYSSHVITAKDNFQGSYSYGWFSASSDGSNLKMLDWQIWSISPDGKRALTYTEDEKVSLRLLDSEEAILLDDTLDYQIDFYNFDDAKTVIWLPNGGAILLAFEQKQQDKRAVYWLAPDGKLSKWEEASIIVKGNYRRFLFLSPNGKELYLTGWEGNKSKYFVINLENSEYRQISINVNSAQNIHISPSGQYISYIDNSFQRLRGCFIYNVADDTSTMLLPNDGLRGQDYCFGQNHWSPIEDKLFGETPYGITLLDASDSSIKELAAWLSLNAGDFACYSINWMPGGKHIFLSVCLEDYSALRQLIDIKYGQPGQLPFTQSLGQRLINVTSGQITEYPDAGFCETAVSPDSKWVLLYACKDENYNVAYPSQLLNLETGEMHPIFQEFISSGSDSAPKQSQVFYPDDWLVYWIP